MIKISGLNYAGLHFRRRGYAMISDEKVQELKGEITKELFKDIDETYCVCDIYLRNNRAMDKKISKSSQKFLNKEHQRLLNVYEKVTILFFRKYEYEKILNEYLQKLYHVQKMEINMIQSDEREKSDDKRKKQEEWILKNIQKLSWEKIIKTNGWVYRAKDNNGKVVQLRHSINNGKNHKVSDIILYDNKKLRTGDYSINDIADIIESTKPKRKMAENLTVVTRPERCKIHGSKNNESNNIEPKQQVVKISKRQYKQIEEVKPTYIKTLSLKYKLRQSAVEDLELKYEKECKHYNKKLRGCEIRNAPCCVFFSDCACNARFIKNVENEAHKRSNIKPERTFQHVRLVSKEYGLAHENVRNCAESYQNKCKYHVGENCFYEEFDYPVCSILYKQCIYNKPFLLEIEQESKKKRQKELIKKQSRIQEVGIKDFVVRGNVFRCMHRQHQIENLDAMINVVDDNGEKQLIKVSAGYCKQCKVYFILESSYQKLKNQGVLLCRVTDEKHYMKSGNVNGMRLAQESILMQYGYNASQTEGLSATRRQKILAVLIDNRILSKSEIISYLDFFINQRSSMSNMEIAISKWETDREFVENYKFGHYTQYGVNAIYRR